ncbi:flagellar protein FlbT [Rhizobiales bacterium GAS188]|nr:flagellar protein FlbT [Rhizobiales bacterium GAS188]
MHISLRSGEKIYLNGAVVRVDRKVSIELLNDVTFLLEAHVMQPQDTNTPLRQLYFVVQTMLIDPSGLERAREMFKNSIGLMIEAYDSPEIVAGLKAVEIFVEQDRRFEALKAIRSLFPAEAAILAESTAKSTAVAREQAA